MKGAILTIADSDKIRIVSDEDEDPEKLSRLQLLCYGAGLAFDLATYVYACSVWCGISVFLSSLSDEDLDE